MILFFVQDLDENQVFLEEDEFRHCIKVLRHTIGDILHVTNGKGTFAKAKIIGLGKRNATLEVLHKEQRPVKKKNITLAVAPPKSKTRWEFLLEKTVECGVDVILPFSSMHSERVRINNERASKIMRSAALQSMRSFHPEIKELTDFDGVLDYAFQKQAQILLAHFDPANQMINKTKMNNREQLILIGPEGDFSQEELKSAISKEATLVNLSDHRLRTETACIAAVALLAASQF